MEKYTTKFKDLLINYTPRVLTALALLIVGLYVIKIIVKATKRVMKNRGVDETLQKFLGDLVSWALKILLFVTVASQLGIETTSFAAILAAAGLAIGMALQGSLANFAGGALIMLFKPFKVGDFIEAQGQMGVVKQIEIFTTKLNTVDNKEVIIPNGVLSNGNIINYSSENKRRVDITVGVSYDADIKQTKDVLYNAINKADKIITDPAPAVVMTELADSSVNYQIRAWTNSADYWDAYFSVLENTKIELDKAGIEIPYPHSVEIKKQA